MSEKSPSSLAPPGKTIEKVVVVPKSKKVNISKGKDGVPLTEKKSRVSILKRSNSDSNTSLFANESTGTSYSSMRTNWNHLAQELRKIREKTKTDNEADRQKALLDAKHARFQGKYIKLKLALRRARILFSKPMFFRHRTLFITFLEVIHPITICWLIFSAFTLGVSWKKAYGERKVSESEIHHTHFIDSNVNELMDRFVEKFTDSTGRTFIAFAPRNEFTVDLMGRVLKILRIENQNLVLDVESHSSFGAIGVNSYNEIMELCLLHRIDMRTHATPVGIEFQYDEKQLSNDSGFPFNLTFVISTFDPSIAATKSQHPYVEPPRKSGWHPPYFDSGFLGLQYAVQTAFSNMIFDGLTSKYVSFVDIQTNSNYKAELIKKALHEPSTFPRLAVKLIFTPNYFDTNVRNLIGVTICSVLCFSYGFLSCFIVRQIVIERKSGIRDLLRMHDMPKYQHWIIFLVHMIVLRTITAFGILWSLFVDFGEGAIFSLSQQSVIFVTLWLHLISLSSFTFFLGTVFDSESLSGIFSVSICFLSYFIPYCLLRTGLVSLFPNVLFSLLFPNWALTNIISEVVDMECDNIGVDWTNLGQSSYESYRISSRITLLILTISAMGYFALAVLNDLVFGRHNTSERTWFQLLQNKYNKWNHRRKSVEQPNNPIRQSITSENPDNDDEYTKPVIFENASTKAQSLVRVRNLSKMYGKHRLVLDNISMNFASGEITILLGQTDSGKSTFIECIAGMVTPTMGSITVNNLDVIRDHEKAREYLGFCPQNVIAFNLLTVMEHLQLCYGLRGLTQSEAIRHSLSLVELLRLNHVKDSVPVAITKDEMRKLGIALCLVDKPTVILLDEPTQGMEALARHEIWDILKTLKREGHTIIMTTTMMDEAEYVADRVALLSHGKLVCYGSPRYLNQQYDTGYCLKIIPNAAVFNLETIQNIAKKHFDTRLLDSPKKIVHDKRSFLLALPKRHIKKYPGFFNELEDNKNKLGIIHYSAEMTNLSDIFIRICETVGITTDTADIYAKKDTHKEWVASLDEQVPVILEEEKYTPSATIQFKAMLRKRWIYTRSDDFHLFWQIIIPLFIIWVTVWHCHVFQEPIEIPITRNFTLDSFPKLKVYHRLSGLHLAEVTMGWRQHVQQLLGDQGEKLLPKSHVLKEILKDSAKEREAKTYSLERRMVALELRAHEKSFEEFLVYFSSGSLHSPPLIMNILGNIFLRAITHNTLFSDNGFYSITCANSPFPTAIESPFDVECGITCVLFGLILSFCIGFLGSELMSFPMEEKATGMKQLQLMSGVHPITFWLGHFVYDSIIAGILTILIMLVFLLNVNAGLFANFETMLAIFIIVGFFLFWSSLPWIYYLSTLVTSKWAKIRIGGITHILIALITMIVLEVALGYFTSPFIIFFRLCFHVFPPYTLTMALRTMFELVSKRGTCLSVHPVVRDMCVLDSPHKLEYSQNQPMQEIFNYVKKEDINLVICCEKICKLTDSCFVPPKYFDGSTETAQHPKLASCLVIFFLQGVLYWILLIISERRTVGRFIQSVVFRFIKNRMLKTKMKDSDAPTDIRKEREQVAMLVKKGKLPREVALACLDITKSFTTHMIINNVCLLVKKGHVCALLGGGGSGKSAIIQMLAGQIVPTKGTVMIGRSNLQENRMEFLRSIGYCSQMDSVFDNFTGSQMMQLMGTLKGVPHSVLKIHVSKWLNVLGLGEIANDKCKMYSASMKRRLCGAMALMGGSPMCLLDEPTRGIDPLARQRFWSIVRHMASLGHSFLFSSFNVEECAEACDKILVLAEGNVQCIGSPMELQNRFSKGFSLLIRVRFEVLTPMEIVSSTVGRVQDLKKTVMKFFKHTVLRDEQDNLLLYYIRDPKMTWGMCFEKAEEIKAEHYDIVEKYVISQASLADVFVLLTNKYRVMDQPRLMESAATEVTQFEAETAALEAATKALHL